MNALQTWNGGVIIISHDERFITTVAKEVGTCCSHKKHGRLIVWLQLWVCDDMTVSKFKGDVQSYKVRVVI
jgi:ATP-binding cassette subfamily F protein 3